MTTDDDREATTAEDGLQFDQAEYETEAPPALACRACSQPLVETYYEANGQTLCPSCRDQVVAHLTGGSGLVRFLRAVLFGSFAALAGTSLYYLVRALTGLEIGLIAILVGFMVGSAVRKGSRARGGWVYQALAIFLTYTAIVSSYVPLIVREIMKQGQAEQAAAPADPARPAAKVGAIKKAPPAVADAPGPQAPKADAKKPAPGIEKLGAGQAAVVLIVGSVAILCFAYALPFLMGAENIIGLAIIFFGLQQAWRMNRKSELAIHGPFVVKDLEPPDLEAAHA